MQQSMSERMDKAMNRVRDMVDTNTMVGTPIHTPEGVTLIPVSRMSFGFASGGGDKNAKDSCAWSGVGAAVRVEPMAFVVVKDGCAHLMNMQPPAVKPLERLLDTAPELMDKLESYVDKYSRRRRGATNEGRGGVY